jgi:hypothetical protein
MIGDVLVHSNSWEKRIDVQQGSDEAGVMAFFRESSGSHQPPQALRNIFIGYRSKSAPVRIDPVVLDEEGEG